MNTRVEGNFIGTDITGTHALGNHSSGIVIYEGASGTSIGGTAPGSRNVISGNTLWAVEMDNSETRNNVVEGNHLGTDLTGTKALGNDGGVLIDNFAADNRIGGTNTAARNVIAGNTIAPGVNLRGGATGQSRSR